MYLVLYDIEDDRLCTRFSKFLQKYGRRLQYSVFEVKNSKRILDNIKTEIKTNFSKKFGQADSVLVYNVVDTDCVAKFGHPVNEEGDLVFL